MRYIAGIDPGLTGAIAVLDFEDFVLHIDDTPVVEQKMSGGTIRKRPHADGMVALFGRQQIDAAAIENVHSTPNDGHVGAFTFGKVTGMTIGVVRGLGIDLTEITPAKWKHDMKVPAAKDAAKYRASQLFPNCALMWARASDHGRAEAAIIALYQAIKLGLAPVRPFAMGLVNGETPKPKRSHN